MLNPQIADKNAKQTFKNSNNNPKRGPKNKLLRMTLKLVDIIQICNPKFHYKPMPKPKRNLTVPAEGVYNNGYDNIDNDYILRERDFIITPEGKE